MGGVAGRDGDCKWCKDCGLLTLPPPFRTMLDWRPCKTAFTAAGWLSFLTGYGVRSDVFFKLLSTHTSIFTRGSLYNAGVVILYLTRELGLSHRGLAASVLPRCAQVLALSVERDLRPVAEWVERGLGVEAPERRVAMMTRCPQLLTLSVAGQLEPRVAMLEELGLTRQQVCGGGESTWYYLYLASQMRRLVGAFVGLCFLKTPHHVLLGVRHCPGDDVPPAVGPPTPDGAHPGLPDSNLRAGNGRRPESFGCLPPDHLPQCEEPRPEGER